MQKKNHTSVCQEDNNSQRQHLGSHWEVSNKGQKLGGVRLDRVNQGLNPGADYFLDKGTVCNVTVKHDTQESVVLGTQ